MQSLFDLQVNGFGGVDFQQPDLTLEELRHAVRILRRHETSRFFLTLITDDIDALCNKFERIEKFREQDMEIREAICGYHLEGPYISPLPGYRGAHAVEFVKAPDEKEFLRMQDAARGAIRLVTLAPEWPESPVFIAALRSQGTLVSLGHTNADENAISAAIDAGATLCTHLGNGCPLEMPRHDNIVQRLLARDELCACFIPDGIHLPPFVLKNLIRAKPAGKVILTTDAMAAAGSAPGEFTLGRLRVCVGDDGVVRNPLNGGFAGSSLTPERAVENTIHWTGMPREFARECLSSIPAALFGLKLPGL